MSGDIKKTHHTTNDESVNLVFETIADATVDVMGNDLKEWRLTTEIKPCRSALLQAILEIILSLLFSLSGSLK